MENSLLNNYQFSRVTRPMTRPAHVKSENMLKKGIIARDGSTIEKATKAAIASKNPRLDGNSSNLSKTLTKRSNQSRVAKGQKPEPRYIDKANDF